MDSTQPTSENQQFPGVEPPSRCPICLDSYSDESYLDSCYHKFCLRCIKQWTNVVSTKHSFPLSLACPLCKTENLSIIYGYDGCSFQRYYINQDTQQTSFFNKEHKYRLRCYYAQPVQIGDGIRFWKSFKYLHKNQWFEAWLRRELQALLQEEDVGIIVHHILGVFDSFLKRNPRNGQCGPESKREEFKFVMANAVGPFLKGRTSRFSDELEMFLASGMTIEAYDAAYKRKLGWERSNSEESDDNREDNVVHSLLFIYDDEDS